MPVERPTLAPGQIGRWLLIIAVAVMIGSILTESVALIPQWIRLIIALVIIAVALGTLIILILAVTFSKGGKSI